jgi:hypothetical protein
MTTRVPLATKTVTFNPHVEVEFASPMPPRPVTTIVTANPPPPVQPPPSWNTVGIVVINNNDTSPSGSHFPSIVLVQNASTGKFEVFRSVHHPSDGSLMGTAVRACAEQTSNTINVTPGLLNIAFSVESTNKRSLTFAVRIQPPKYGIQSHIFHQNLSLLRMLNADSKWTEHTHITSVSIKEAMSSGILTNPSGSDFSMFDINGTPIIINADDAETIRDTIRMKLHTNAPVHPVYFVKAYNDKFNGNKNTFLNGTGCYLV